MGYSVQIGEGQRIDMLTNDLETVVYLRSPGHQYYERPVSKMRYPKMFLLQDSKCSSVVEQRIGLDGGSSNMVTNMK